MNRLPEKLQVPKCTGFSPYLRRWLEKGFTKNIVFLVSVTSWKALAV
jgi:hypothetical protein